MPLEIVDMIVQHLLDDAVVDVQKRWNSISRCYYGTCKVSDHIGQQAYDDLLKEHKNAKRRLEVLKKMLKSGVEFDERLDEEYERVEELSRISLDPDNEYRDEWLEELLCEQTKDTEAKPSCVCLAHRKEYLSYATLRNKDGNIAFKPKQHFVEAKQPLMNKASFMNCEQDKC